MLINITTFTSVPDFMFRNNHPNTSFPRVLTDAILAPYGYAVLNPTTPPTYDAWTHRLIEGTPEQRDDGKWYQTWVLEPVTHTADEEAQRLTEAKATKLTVIDSETSASILSGFDYTVDETGYHFSYGSFDQQNFADTANVCILKLQGVAGLPDSVTWNAYTVPGGELVRLTFDASGFLTLYAGGAMAHKNTVMQTGGTRKAAVEVATTVEEVNAT